MSINEFDTILDAETGHSAKTFRTADGVCKIFKDRIEITKNRDEISSLVSQPYFIFRIATIVLVLALVVYFRIGSGLRGMGNYSLLIPLGILIFSLFGNINVYFYRLRAVLFIILVLVLAWWDYSGGNLSGSLLYLGFGVMLGSGLIRSFDYAFIPAIERKDIVSVRFINSIPYLSRAYFVISFHHESGKIRKRPIMMPGAFDDGEAEKRHAYQLLKEEGFLN